MITQTFLSFFSQYPDQAILFIGVVGICFFESAQITHNKIYLFVSSILITAMLCIAFEISTYPAILGKFYMIFLCSMLVIDYVMIRNFPASHYTEKKIFIVFWAIAGHLLIAQTNWMSFYLGIELSTIPFYALVALSAHPHALEGALKYFIVNACFSVLWLFSLTLVLTGTEGFSYQAISLEGAPGLFFSVITALLVALKLGAFPCAYWAPDFYQVSSRSTILWMSFVPKYLMLVVLYHFFSMFAFSKGAVEIVIIFTVLGVLWGHFGAVFQSNVQRFLGYTAAAQIGFLISPIIVQGSDGVEIALMYLIVYTLSLLVFLYGLQRSFLENVQMIMCNKGSYGVYAGSYFAGLLSLAGFPPFPGFFAKLYVLQGVLSEGQYMPLAVFLVLSNMISLFYYMEWIFKTRSVFAPSVTGSC